MERQILQKAMDIHNYITEIRRHIHQNPEIGMEEVETTSLVKRELEKMGVEVVPLNTKVGVLGILKGEKEGSNTVTALRADMDALPIKEQTGLPYASLKDGIMHACGHDGHTAVLLGVAKLLSSLRKEFSGTVKFIFQPGEEVLIGAKSMVAAGVLENPKPDTIVALHSWPYLEIGKIGVWPGAYMASADKFTVTMTGSGGHGAYPHKAKDPLLAAAYGVISLQNIVSRQIDALEKVVVSVCTINAGKAFNVIPEEVVFTGTVRCHNQEIRESIPAQMEQILNGVAASFGVNVQLDYIFGLPPTINDPEVIDLISKAATEVLGEGHVEQLERPAMSSEDFSIFLEQVPYGAFFRLGNTNPGETPVYAHNDHFDFNDKAIPIGIAVLTQFVLNKNQ